MDITIMVIDKDICALKRLAADIRVIAPKSSLILCGTPEEALRYASLHIVDIVFLDSNFFSMNSLEIASRLRKINSRLNIIFIAETDDFAAGAFKFRASGYLLKPVGPEEIRIEFDNLRYPPELTYKDISEWKLRIKCFGNFEVFGPDDNPLNFPRLRCKETLAYLVDRTGAGVTVRQIASVLWDDREFDLNLQKQTQTIIASMMKTLKAAGAEAAISKQRNNIAILPDKVECDFFQFLKGDLAARSQYTGEYMSQYSWSEYTNGDLWRLENQVFGIRDKKSRIMSNRDVNMMLTL